MLAIVIPAGFSSDIMIRARQTAAKAMNSFGLPGDSIRKAADPVNPLTLYYHPILQESFRASVRGALGSAVQLVPEQAGAPDPVCSR